MPIRVSLSEVLELEEAALRIEQVDQVEDVQRDLRPVALLLGQLHCEAAVERVLPRGAARVARDDLPDERRQARIALEIERARSLCVPPV